MRASSYESPAIDVLTLSPTDVLTASFGGNTPLEDEEW